MIIKECEKSDNNIEKVIPLKDIEKKPHLIIDDESESSDDDCKTNKQNIYISESESESEEVEVIKEVEEVEEVEEVKFINAQQIGLILKNAKQDDPQYPKKKRFAISTKYNKSL